MIKQLQLQLFSLLALFCCAILLPGCGRQEPKPLRVGDPAPQFAATDLAGAPVSLATLAGRPVILRFWSTECKFCRADTPIFNRFYTTHAPAGLEVFYVNTSQSEADVRRFIQELQVLFPVIRDPGGEIAQLFHIKAQPITIVLGPDHRVLAALLGGVSEAELHTLLAPYLGEKK